MNSLTLMCDFTNIIGRICQHNYKSMSTNIYLCIHVGMNANPC